MAPKVFVESAEKIWALTTFILQLHLDSFERFNNGI